MRRVGKNKFKHSVLYQELRENVLVKIPAERQILLSYLLFSVLTSIADFYENLLELIHAS
jgi:hypothetical protein